MKLISIYRQILSENNTTTEYDNIDDVYELRKYSVKIHTDTTVEELIETYDYEDALWEYKHWTIEDVDDKRYRELDHIVELSVDTSYYKFLLTDEDVTDYPIEEFFDDGEVYEWVDDGYYKTLKDRDVKGINKDADELLGKLQSHFHYEFGGRSYKYFDISIEDDSSESVGWMQLRIADHTPNLSNIHRHGGNILAQLNVIVSDQDPTQNKFISGTGMYNDIYVEEMRYSGEDLPRDYEVIEEIESRIEEIKSDILEKIKSGEIMIESLRLTDILKELRSRDDMPQIKTDELGDAIVILQKNGVETSEDYVIPTQLKHSQKEIIPDKLSAIVQKLQDMRLQDMKPVVISSDDGIVDGHHRVEAVKMMGKGDYKIPCIRIDLPIDQAIEVYKQVEKAMKNNG